MNVQQIRTLFAATSGFSAETAREKALIDDTIRHIVITALLPNSPNKGLRVRMDWKLEMTTPVLDSDNTPVPFTVHSTDLRALYAPASAVATELVPTILRGRHILLKRADASTVIVRCQDVFQAQFGQDPVTYQWIILDQHMETADEEDIQVTFFTLDYPIPGDVVNVLTPIRMDPVSQQAIPLEMAFTRDLADTYRQGQLIKGRPSRVSYGQDYTVPAPHHQPQVVATEQAIGPSEVKWGYDDTPAEVTTNEAAGTFRYCYCFVWGRRQWLRPTKGWGFLAPYLMSPPSKSSDAITTTWGSSRIIISSPDMEYVFGFGHDDSAPSYHRSGIEKWWFRARDATQSATASGNNSDHKHLEADGQFYLWRITDASTTTIYDRGEYGPVDRDFPLPIWPGTKSLRLDCMPSVADVLTCDVIRRPAEIISDADLLGVPPEADAFVIAHLRQKLLANRANDPKYAAAIQNEIDVALRAYKAAAGRDSANQQGASRMGFLGRQAPAGVRITMLPEGS